MLAIEPQSPELNITTAPEWRPLDTSGCRYGLRNVLGLLGRVISNLGSNNWNANGRHGRHQQNDGPKI